MNGFAPKHDPACDRTAIRLERMPFHVLLLLRGETVARDVIVGAILSESDSSPVRAAKLRRRLGERVEYNLQIECRSADHLQHVGGGGLLLQRFAQFVEQPGILDGDNSLSSEVGEQLDLLVGEGAHFLTKDADHSNEFVVLEHWHDDIGPNAAKLGRIDGCRIAFSVSSRRCEISSVKHSLGSDHLAKRIAVAGMDDLSAFACFGKGGWHIVCGDRPKPISFIEKKVAKIRLAKRGRVRQHGLEHWLQITGRAGNDTQYL